MGKVYKGKERKNGSKIAYLYRVVIPSHSHSMEVKIVQFYYIWLLQSCLVLGIVQKSQFAPSSSLILIRFLMSMNS